MFPDNYRTSFASAYSGRQMRYKGRAPVRKVKGHARTCKDMQSAANGPKTLPLRFGKVGSNMLNRPRKNQAPIKGRTPDKIARCYLPEAQLKV